jgi:nicotinate-nucleotide pyrophosphorylase (carboxylating)
MIKLPSRWIEDAFIEDAPYGDVASDLAGQSQTWSEARLLAKAPGIICGLPFIPQFLSFMDSDCQVDCQVSDGETISPGQELCNLKGSTSALLRSERLMLNLLSYLSGVATQTKTLQDIISPYGVKLLDTRKTLPHYRALVKYAVRIGGGFNHRNSLSDLIMLKDNHVKAGGGVSAILEKWKTSNQNPMLKLEIEVSTLEDALEALPYHPDIIMLDNFTPEKAAQAIPLLKGNVLIEISGGITLDNIEAYAKLQPDFISTGSMTHHVHALDLSMKLS